MLTSRYLPQIPFLRHMVLTPPGSHGLGDPDQPRLKFDTGILQSMIGRGGVTHTLLRPAGKAEIDGRIVDVQSEGGMIAAGTPIEVVSASGNRIVVREVMG
jgi:membrane-bound serine protease (ClpP class)